MICSTLLSSTLFTPSSDWQAYFDSSPAKICSWVKNKVAAICRVANTLT